MTNDNRPLKPYEQDLLRSTAPFIAALGYKRFCDLIGGPREWTGQDGSTYKHYEIEPRIEGGISWGKHLIIRTFPKNKR